MERGEILVGTSTDPSWTPLFGNAAAIVMERGGPLSHAAIVARELDVPAVLGVEGALASIAPGSTIRVDGSRGTVEVIDGNGPHEEGQS
jgi:pyruvate,water dikinase